MVASPQAQMAAGTTAPQRGGSRPDPRFAKQFVKTKFCAFWQEGGCSYGHQCKFAHHAEELQPRPDLTKTSLCQEWKEGRCPRPRHECPRAHGHHELRAMEPYVRRPVAASARTHRNRRGFSGGSATDDPAAGSPIGSPQGHGGHGVLEWDGTRSARYPGAHPQARGVVLAPTRFQDASGALTTALANNSLVVVAGVVVWPEYWPRIQSQVLPVGLAVEVPGPVLSVPQVQVQMDMQQVATTLRRAMPDHYED